MRAPRHWRSVLAGAALAYGVAAAAGLVAVVAGFYDVAATTPHWDVTRWLAETTRTRSIRAHASGIVAPAGLSDPKTLAMGVEHFAMHCAVCHGAPGVPRGDIGNGLYPQAPDLAVAGKVYTEAELFWIIKHGIKMTGMPSWADHSDAEVWATVSFLKKLAAGMTPAEYGDLIKENLMHGMQHSPGGMGMKEHRP